ncbi:HNH endonuclease [Paenibacillus macquariensis]|uniref:HNH endonuclease n=2 Tax=Paenibacillus macquariensis TaxID=948756 RepID=A0ABY1JXA7_9BACL|nr:HNH endonuclease [Paenibacillus macquariensis]
MIVDHINHDTLDNTSDNLRNLTNAQNMQNRKGAASNSSSGVRGVNWHKQSQKWNVQLRIDGKRMSFGYFEDIEEAKSAAIHARNQHMPYATDNIA